MFAGISETNAFLMISVAAKELNIFDKENGEHVLQGWGMWDAGTVVLGDIDIYPASSGHHFRGRLGYPADGAHQARNYWDAGGWGINKVRRG